MNSQSTVSHKGISSSFRNQFFSTKAYPRDEGAVEDLDEAADWGVGERRVGAGAREDAHARLQGQEGRAEQQEEIRQAAARARNPSRRAAQRHAPPPRGRRRARRAGDPREN